MTAVVVVGDVVVSASQDASIRLSSFARLNYAESAALEAAQSAAPPSAPGGGGSGGGGSGGTATPRRGARGSGEGGVGASGRPRFPEQVRGVVWGEELWVLDGLYLGALSRVGG